MYVVRKMYSSSGILNIIDVLALQEYADQFYAVNGLSCGVVMFSEKLNAAHKVNKPRTSLPPVLLPFR